MAIIKNPWGKGSTNHDRWFQNLWKKDNDNVLIADIVPSIDRWEVKNSGTTSKDNDCPVCPKVLGIDIDPQYFANAIELKAFIINHNSGYRYNIRRRATLIIWELSTKDGWKKTGDYPTYIDDKNDFDEMLTPKTSDPANKTDKTYFIYVEDRPTSKNPPNFIPDATSVVVITNMEEYVEIKNLQTSTSFEDSNTQKWHTRMYITLDNGIWSMDKGRSSVGAEFVSVDMPTD